MGQTSSCCANNETNNSLSTEDKNRASIGPLSSQDAERNRARDIINSSTNVPSKADIVEPNISSSSYSKIDLGKYSHENQKIKADNGVWSKSRWIEHHHDLVKDTNNSQVKTENVSQHSIVNNDKGSTRIVGQKHLQNSRDNSSTTQKMNLFRWKKNKSLSSSTVPKFQSRILTYQNNIMEKTLYYFVTDDVDAVTKDNKSSRASARHIITLPCGKKGLPRVEYSRQTQYITKLVVKDIAEIRNYLIKKLPNRSKKDVPFDPVLICGTQIYATRYIYDCNHDEEKTNNDITDIQIYNNDLSMSEKIQCLGKSARYLYIHDVNPSKASYLEEKDLKLMLKGRSSIDLETPIEGRERSVKPKLEQDVLKLSFENGEFLSAKVPTGIARTMFDETAIHNTIVEPVRQMVCVSAEHDIYVCDIGLSSSRCDFIVDTAERCSNGRYNAYTYAKQTLGCREYDELAVVCEWPVMRAVVSIRDHLEAQGSVKRRLVLDDREPHIVKYDISRKERQKLEMHTDKSEWTFLIALTDGIGDDYDGGGTYMECIDSTIHLQKGHALIFPGKLRHRGQKIINGKRFLLVGFLIQKKDSELETRNECIED